jgi:hypothetical protein
VGGDSVAAGSGDAGAVGSREESSRPLLMVDIDGVISLFAGPDGRVATAAAGPEGAADGGPAIGGFHSIEGIPHFLSATAAAHLLDLSDHFELVWASGWEERADDHLPHLLGLPAGIPFLRFDRAVGRSNAHWKLDAIERHAGARPLAWIDDALDERCHAWAQRRAAPTLLVETDPRAGLTAREVELLMGWERALRATSA